MPGTCGFAPIGLSLQSFRNRYYKVVMCDGVGLSWSFSQRILPCIRCSPSTFPILHSQWILPVDDFSSSLSRAIPPYKSGHSDPLKIDSLYADGLCAGSPHGRADVAVFVLLFRGSGCLSFCGKAVVACASAAFRSFGATSDFRRIPHRKWQSAKAITDQCPPRFESL